MANSNGEFSYNLEERITFADYFYGYEDVFRKEYTGRVKGKTGRLLLQKFNPASHDRYCNYILPRKLGEISFDETVQILTNIFGKGLLFNIRWKYLNLTKKEDDYFFIYAGVVNKFKLEELSLDRFKCLIFVQGLISSGDTGSDFTKIGRGSKAHITDCLWVNVTES